MILHGATFRHQLLLFTDSVVRKSQGNLLLFQPTSSFEELCRIQSFSQLLATPDWPSQAVCPPSLSLRSLLMSSVSPLLSFLPFPFYFTLYRSSPNSAVDPRSNQTSHFSLFSTHSIFVCPLTPFPPLCILVIRLTLSMWQWSVSNPDSRPCLIGMIVHLFHHLPPRARTHTHNHYLKHKKTPPCCDHYFKDFANRMTSCRAACVSCVYSVSVLFRVCVWGRANSTHWLLLVESPKTARLRNRNS